MNEAKTRTEHIDPTLKTKSEVSEKIGQLKLQVEI